MTREELACARDHHQAILTIVDRHQAIQTTVDHHLVICHQVACLLADSHHQAILKTEDQAASQASLAHNAREVHQARALETCSVINDEE